MFRDFKRDLRIFPDARTWSTLIGAPYITVSAKGIANGKSNIINNGADFGPDTPGTTTNGIMEAITIGLPKVYNVATKRYVPSGIVKLIDPLIYVGTEPIYIHDDWQVILEGAEATAGNITANTGSVYQCSSTNGVLALIPNPYGFTQGTAYITGGYLALRNISFIATSLISDGVPSSLTNMSPPSDTLYYPLNFGVAYTNNAGQTTYATVMVLELDNVSVTSTGGVDNAAMRINTNHYETIYFSKGNFQVATASAYYNPVVYINAFHWNAEIMDIAGGATGNNGTDYPTLQIYPGMRCHIGIIHFGSGSVYPLFVGSNFTDQALVIDQIGFELGTPPTSSGGYFYNGHGGYNMTIHATTIVGAWGGGWHPLTQGSLVRIGDGAYLKIGKGLDTTYTPGTGDSFTYPWGNASAASGITQPITIYSSHSTNSYPQLQTDCIFVGDKPKITVRDLTAQSITSTTAAPVVLDAESGVTSIDHSPRTTYRYKITAKLTISNNTVGDSITVGIYQGTTLLASETYTQEGAASNPHDTELIYIYNQSDISPLVEDTNQEFSVQASVSAGTGSVIVKEFTIEEII